LRTNVSKIQIFASPAYAAENRDIFTKEADREQSNASISDARNERQTMVRFVRISDSAGAPDGEAESEFSASFGGKKPKRPL
jgi:hypothetical protein